MYESVCETSLSEKHGVQWKCEEYIRCAKPSVKSFDKADDIKTSNVNEQSQRMWWC